MKQLPLLALTALCMTAAPSHADPITVPNFSFEAPDLESGFAGAIAEWTKSTTGAGVFVPPGFGQAALPTDGDQIAFMNAGSGQIFQTLSATYQPGTDYTLSVDVAGRSAPGEKSMAMYLYWGTITGLGGLNATNTVGVRTLDADAGVEGDVFKTFELTIAAADVPSGAIGQTIGIGFFGLGGASGTSDFDLDRVTLTANSGVSGPAFKLAITRAVPPATGFDFEWESQEGKVYDLVTSTDLVTPIPEWPVYDPDGEGGNPPYGDIPAQAESTTTTLAAVPGDGARRFFVIVEKDGPPPPTAPELSSVWGSGTIIMLNLTGEMEETAATDPWNYDVFILDIFWMVNSAVLSPDGKTVTLTLGSALADNTTYSVTMRNLTGIEGTPLGGATTVEFITALKNEPKDLQFQMAPQMERPREPDIQR